MQVDVSYGTSERCVLSGTLDAAQEAIKDGLYDGEEKQSADSGEICDETHEDVACNSHGL